MIATVDDVLAEVSNDKRTCFPVVDLIKALADRGLTRVWAALDATESAGYVAVWPTVRTRRTDRFVTLSPGVAAGIGIELDESGDNWQTIGTPPKRVRPSRGKLVAETDHWNGCDLGLDSLADPRACDPSTPLIQVEESELQWYAEVDRIERLYLKGNRKRPKPRPSRIEVKPWRLLGLGVSWPIPPSRDGVCPVCLDSTLDLGSVCLSCHRTATDNGRPLIVIGRAVG